MISSARTSGMNTFDRRDGLRVLYYSHSGDVSGAEISLLLTLSHIRAKAVDAILVAPSGEVLKRASELGITAIPVRSFRARMSRNPWLVVKGIFGTVRAGLELRRVIEQSQPDIVHANSIRAGLIAIVGVVGRRTQLVWHIRDNLPQNLVGKAIRAVASWRANKVFAISRAIAADFAVDRRLKRKTVVVHNGIDVRQPEGHSIRFHTKTPLNRFVVGVVGQIAPWKRQQDAMDAFAAFHQDAPNSELWIVGEPKFREENIQYAKGLEVMAQRLGIVNRVRFLGFRSDVANVMASMDVLLVTSENEPFGRVIIEAMLAGKPVIGTRGGGIPEIIQDEETGFLVDVGDTKTMEQLLHRIYRSKKLQKMLGEGGRARCVSQFSIETTCTKIQQVYEIVAEPKGSFGNKRRCSRNHLSRL